MTERENICISTNTDDMITAILTHGCKMLLIFIEKNFLKRRAYVKYAAKKFAIFLCFVIFFYK